MATKRSTTLCLCLCLWMTALLAAAACSDKGGDGDAVEALPPPADTSPAALARRAYVVDRDHQQMTVIDLGAMEIIGRVATKGVANHMAELSADFGKVFVSSSETDELVVVDARTLRVGRRVPIGKHPTHLALVPGGRLLAVMVEDEDAVAFVDTATDQVVKTLPGFYTPHFMRFDAAGKVGYVANIGAGHITRVDLDRLEIVDHIALDGASVPPTPTLAPGEGGFADAQIDRSGMLYAAHISSGKVIVYDTVAGRKLPDLFVGRGPWVVFADHHFDALPLQHFVPNFQDRSVAMIDGTRREVVHHFIGDEEAYGVNYSSRTPNKAFVMNRVRKDIAVVDTAAGDVVARIPVGGNTETAATTADGRYIVATVSSAARIVFIDPETHAIARSFDGVGRYPWSVTIPNGQNYCH
jgi:YVTN family beta-propeller protein